MNLKRSISARAQLGAVGAAAVVAIALANPAAAASPSASVANDTLTVNGGSGKDRVALRLEAGAPETLQVDFGDDGSAEHSFDRSTFSRIDVFLGNGHDEFRVDQANGAFDEALSVHGQGGNDTLNGGDGDEVFDGGSGNDTVDGNRGNDTAFLGSGADTFRWDPGDGSDVVEGGAGVDTLDFNGADADEVMNLTPDGQRSLFLRDLGNIRMDMDDVELLDLTALGGTDSVTIDDMTGTDMRRADVDLAGSSGGGDGSADIVTVNGTPQRDRIDVDAKGSRVEVRRLRTETRITGTEGIDLLQVNGRGGNDRVNVDSSASALIGIAFDLRANLP